ncbi:hypothetical protein D3C72_2017080 [compost metagenome]
MQDDRLGSAGNMDGAIGIATVDDVGRIGSSAERLLALDEGKLAAATEAVAHTVGLRRHLPFVGKEALLGLVGEAIPVETGQDTQGDGCSRQAPQLLSH